MIIRAKNTWVAQPTDTEGQKLVFAERHGFTLQASVKRNYSQNRRACSKLIKHSINYNLLDVQESKKAKTFFSAVENKRLQKDRKK